ncbi:MAG: sigma-54-dependent transcriptional regulator [Planctomycetota bacterium]
MKTILVIDDERAMRFALKRALEKKYRVLEAEDGERGLNVLGREHPDCVILDQNMPGLTGLEVLAKIREDEAAPPVVMLTAHGSERVAVDAMKQGAADYLSKPYDIEELRLVCKRAMDVAALTAENQSLKEALAAGTGRGQLIGDSEPMRKVKDVMARVGPLDATVLIEGESGTGKEVVARGLHALSPRRSGPFVAVNCAALPETLMESELFGHDRGAFTGALATRAGRFEQAEGGTIFLDEIGEAPAALQAKLLRVLEARTYVRVGGTEERSADVRLIAATNRDLKDRVKQGAFREDLYYRLKVIDLTLPALRGRGEDILALARHFIGVAALKHGMRARPLTEKAAAALLRYSFPGNVRELLHAMEKATILAPTDLIRLADLPAEVTEEAGDLEQISDEQAAEGFLAAELPAPSDRGSEGEEAPADQGAPGPGAAAHGADVKAADAAASGVLDQVGLNFAEAKRLAVERFERALLTRELVRHRGNVSRSARGLGLHRQSLQNKLRELGIDAASFRE